MNDERAPEHTVHPWVARGRESIRFGIGIVGPRPEWPALINWVQQAESLGFDSFWAPDHPMLMMDCWSQLAALAVTTKQIRLGSLVSCVYHRNPALLARLAGDVDRLSNGRLVLGLGIGRSPVEFAQMGLPYMPTRVRQEGLQETIEIVRGLWGEAPFTYEGAQFRIHEGHVQPPLQKPYVPFLIAGGGERVTLRQVARYADVSNFGPLDVTGGASTVEDVTRKLETLRRYCLEDGRPYETVLRSHYVIPLIIAKTPPALREKVDAVPAWIQSAFRSGFVAGTVDEVILYYRNLIAAGMQYFIASLLPDDLETLQILAQEVIPGLDS